MVSLNLPSSCGFVSAIKLRSYDLCFRPSHRHSTKLAEANLPSPRQQEVAHAVQFGVAGSNGEFPYIDDVTPSTDERMVNIQATIYAYMSKI